MPDGYHFFWSGPLSQWHPSSIKLWGEGFGTAERAMMVGKARLFEDHDTARQILPAEEPDKQKALGRRVRNVNEGTWDAHKVDIVTEVNMAKYDQNKGLRRKPFQTGTAQLVEASPLDTIGGIGLDATNAAATPLDEWPGQNLLGKILTEVRETLRARYPEETVACS